MKNIYPNDCSNPPKTLSRWASKGFGRNRQGGYAIRNMTGKPNVLAESSKVLSSKRQQKGNCLHHLGEHLALGVAGNQFDRRGWRNAAVKSA